MKKIKNVSARIIFFGATEMGYACCEELIAMGHCVAAIYTIPKRFKTGSDQKIENVLYEDLKKLGKEHEIPVFQLTRGQIGAHRNRIAVLKPDLLVVVGWYFLLPRAITTLASKGAIAAHASLLPKYRGHAPLVHAVINGEKETGVTLFYLDEGVDTGDIVGQKGFPILKTDTIRELIQKATAAASYLLKKYVPQILKGTAPRIPQKHSKATLYPRRTPKDGLIDWTWNTFRIKNFIRAQTKPYPGAYTLISGKKVTIWEADITDGIE